MTDDQHEPEPEHKVGYKSPPMHTRFKPGQSGNPSGLPKGRRSIYRIAMKLMKKDADKLRKYRPKDGYEAAALALINNLRKGDVQSLKYIIDRQEGKVPDVVSTPDGGGLTVVFKRRADD